MKGKLTDTDTAANQHAVSKSELIEQLGIMARYKDHSPVSHTCPWIDEAIYVLQNSECGYNTAEINSAIKALEKVRSANDELRNWGNELYEEVVELKAEIDKLETMIAGT